MTSHAEDPQTDATSGKLTLTMSGNEAGTKEVLLHLLDALKKAGLMPVKRKSWELFCNVQIKIELDNRNIVK